MNALISIHAIAILLLFTPFASAQPSQPQPVMPPTSATDPTETERKELDAEAAAIKVEATRIANWRTTLEGKIKNLRDRIESHNRNKPDPTNASAVRIYNDQANRLNRELDDLKAEEKRFDAARLQLLKRVERFDQRLKKFGKK
ncbi:MAG: siphovirus Gp157 family protein [Planctomycetia bacterium]|nr:siphovirus Gp157 family protein [Planctomycetia bacterium]